MISIKDCACGNRCEGNTSQCASCNARDRRAARLKPSDNNTPINQKSEKQSQWDRKYLAKVKVWKRGKKCLATFPHECSLEITCHHMSGRSVNAFHDEYAGEKGIPELMDDRFWMPLCLNAHAYVTEHSKFAWENGYSFKKVSDKIFQKS